MKKIILLVIIALVFAMPVTYSFGIKESLHPDLFSEQTNRVLKANKDYSWLTFVPIGEEIVQIEHSVLATEQDKQRLKLPKGNYLFFSINVGKNTKITDITAEHSYKDKNLEEVGTYIYSTYRLPDGSIDKSKKSWKITKYEKGPISDQYGFGYIKIYKAPDDNMISRFIPKLFWFQGNIDEKISIKTNDGKPYDFNFELIWHKSSSLWWQFMTVT
jgi:hypothetical protein